ncbi:DNA dC-_dU-editing enzyme APOBEC3 isoform X3 [Balaenoptera acutorostrata]|uniref:single-stranded DNA cytosine deaminase n=1 Tax=Balaenoptera acutorostrata TaxID=9767 RepID=A0ABM3UGD7_BALAC|nr:DNA dC->dU-editing enzyme APOBEC3 isoform X3 [Balaenoptera acutorostrata]
MEPQRPRQRAGLGLASKGGCSQRPRIRNPVEWLDRQTFSFHFRNLRFANGRNCSYLCYQVERLKHCSPDSTDWGVFQNRVYPETPCHAELCFLSWFCAKKLSPYEQYRITWFLSWSPCLSCAEQVAAFLKENRNVRLSIFAARLYYFWKPECQHGLRLLHHQRAWVRLMSLRDPLQKQRHAEICFIDKITSLNLDPNQSYKIICYVTWSPCPTCARELVDFINGQDHLSLQIFASRLYFHWVKLFQRGLQQLQAAQVSVAVMTRSEFEDCWEEFVDNQGMPFESWDKLEQYSESISRRLRKILLPSNWNNLEDSFRDLRLGSPSPSSLRSDSR